MGNAPSKSEPKSAKVSRVEDDESQQSKQSAFRPTRHEAPKVPVREETEPTQLPSIPTGDHELSSDGKHGHPEPSVEDTPATSEHQVSPLKASKKTPNSNIQGQDCSQDGQDLEASLQAGPTTKLRRQNSMLPGEAIEVRDIASAYSDATAERPGDSKDSSNVDNTIAEERPEDGCADGRRDLEVHYTGPSESTAPCTEARHSGPRHSTEAASEVHSPSHQKSVRTLNFISSQNVSISSAPSKPSSSKFLSENSNLPSSTSLPTRQVSKKPWKTVLGASLLRALPSYSMDMAIGGDAFRMPEMLEQSSTQSFRYKADAECTLQMRSKRIPCPPSCVFCRKATSNIAEIVENDNGALKNTEVKPSTVDPADDLKSGNAESDIASPSNFISKETLTQMSPETAVMTAVPRRTLHPGGTNDCASPLPIRDQEAPRSHIEPASTNSEQALDLGSSIKSSRLFHARGSNAFDEVLPGRVFSVQEPHLQRNELAPTSASFKDACREDSLSITRLLKRQNTPPEPAISIPDECSQQTDDGDTPMIRTVSGKIDVHEVIEGAAGRAIHVQRNSNTFTWSSLDDPLLLRNILQFIRLVVASRRPMLSFTLADERGIELQLHNLVQGCPNEYHGNEQVHSSLDGLPCGTQRNERFGPQTMLSPPQQPSSLRSAPLSHSKVDSLIQGVRSFLQKVQQFSLQVESLPQQVQTVLEEVKSFQQRAEHFKHEMDSFAQEVPNCQTRVPCTALQVRSFDELRHSFALIVECFARLMQTFSQQLHYSLRMTKEVNAASGQAQGHSQDAHDRSEETQAVQEKVQSSPQRDGNSGQNEHIFVKHGDTFTQQAHFYRSLKSRMIQSPINTPTSRYSARSQRRNSPQDVVNVAAKQARGGFPRGFGSAHREPRDLNQVEAHATGHGDIVQRVEKSPCKTSQTEPSRNPPTPPGFVTTGGTTSSSRKDCSRAHRSSSCTPPPLAEADVSEEGSGLGKSSENRCSSQSRRMGPHPESPAKDTSPKELLGRPSESGELCIPSEASVVTAQPSPSRHPDVSAEGVQSSKDGSHTSPIALVQLWRSFSIIRKRVRKDRKTE